MDNDIETRMMMEMNRSGQEYLRQAPQLQPAVTDKVSTIVENCILRFCSLPIEIFRLGSCTGDSFIRYLNSLKITLTRKGFFPVYVWQYIPAEQAYFLFLGKSKIFYAHSTIGLIPSG